MERDHFLAFNHRPISDFNSHAHVERDPQSVRSWSRRSRISTHTLTWSVTVQKEATAQRPQISTHTLTWSVTDDGTHQKTIITDFNSHAHVERDTSVKYRKTDFVNFNSHAHVERDTSRVRIMAKSVRFQLTRSRGA